MAVVVVLGLAAAGAELPKEKPDGRAEDPLLALLVPNANPVVAVGTAADPDMASGFDAPNPPPMGVPNAGLACPKTNPPPEDVVVVVAVDSAAGLAALAPKENPPVDGGEAATLPKLKPEMTKLL